MVGLNASIGPIIDSMAAMFPSLVSLVIAAIPVVVVIALATFIVSFLDKIVKKIG